jgi:hypothetical protein
MPLLFSHIQYYFHTHPGQTGVVAIVHFLNNEIVQGALLASILFALILLTRTIIRRWKLKKIQYYGEKKT